MCRRPAIQEQTLTSNTRLVVDWAGMGPTELAAWRARCGPVLDRWSVHNCMPRPVGRWGKGLRYLAAALSVAAAGGGTDRIVLWQQWIGYLCCLLPRSPRAPRLVIATVLYGPTNAPPGSMRRWLLVRALQRADALIYFSKALADDTRRAWPQWAHKVHHTRLPLLDEIPSDPPQTGSARAGDRSSILRVFAGGSSERDVDIVVEAFSGTDVPVTLVCPGHQAIRHPERVTPNITVYRDVPEATFHALARASDVAVVALRSATSACGQLLFTFCMRHRIPLIATEAHGTRDYVQHGRTGLHIPVGDACALRAAYQRLSTDAALRQRLQDGGQALARQLSFGHFARFVDGL